MYSRRSGKLSAFFEKTDCDREEEEGGGWTCSGGRANGDTDDEVDFNGLTFGGNTVVLCRGTTHWKS